MHPGTRPSTTLAVMVMLSLGLSITHWPPSVMPYFAASTELISTQFSGQISIRNGLFWVTMLQCIESFEWVTCSGYSSSGITERSRHSG